MVHETGDATEKFLRSMAAGDATAQHEFHTAAEAALDTLCLPFESSSPACLNLVASQLSNNAAALSQQINGLLQVLQSRRDDEGAGSSKSERLVALQQLKAALAATSQLRQLAEEAQEALASDGRDGNTGRASRESVLESVSEGLEQNTLSLSGGASETRFRSDFSRDFASRSALRANLSNGLSLPVEVGHQHRRFSHDGGERRVRGDWNSPASVRRPRSSDGGAADDPRALRGSQSLSVTSAASSSSSYGSNAGNSDGVRPPSGSGRLYQRGRSLVSRLSLDIPAANLAAAAAASRKDSESNIGT